MTFILNYLRGFLKKPEHYFFFSLKPSEKKKIIRHAVEGSSKMQVELLERYKKQFPNETQQFYTN